MSKEALKLNATFQQWVGETEEFTIFVPTKVYEEHLRKFFEHLGIKKQSWEAILRAAIETWDRQYIAEEAFRADLGYWLSCDDPNVRIRRGSVIRAAVSTEKKG